MYHPKTTTELFEILSDLQHYAELNKMPKLSEALADAGLLFAMDRHEQGEDERGAKAGQKEY